MHLCPHCQSQTLVKAGFNRSGSQRYQCKQCKRYATLEPQLNGYAKDIRERALKLCLEGNGLRRIGRVLEVTHQTIANWINASHAALHEPISHPSTVETIELDKLFTFVGSKKNRFIWLQRLIALRVVSWDGKWSGSEPLKRYKMSLIKPRVPNNISVMA